MSEETSIATFGAGNKLAALINNPEAAAKAVENARQAAVLAGAKAGSGGLAILKVDQATGKWSMNREEVPDDTLFAIDPLSLSRGMLCWKGGQPIEEVMRPVLEGLPPEVDQTKNSPFKNNGMEGWSDAVAFKVVTIGSGIEGRFTSTSGGGHGMFKDLLDKVTDKIVGGDGFAIPIVKLASESYFSKNYSKDIVNPVVNIAGWSDVKGTIVMNDAGGAIEGSLA